MKGPAAALAAALVLAWSYGPGGVQADVPAASHGDEPPPGFSGGFGEDTCQACHFSFDVNEPPGVLLLSGVPVRWKPGERYPLEIVLTRPGMAIGGFQLTARFEDDGEQAGGLSAPDEAADRITVASSLGVEYIHHLRAGTELDATDTARWIVHWTAPEAGGTVRFHVAANAANDDDSQFGDYIYATEAEAGPPEGSGSEP